MDGTKIASYGSWQSPITSDKKLPMAYITFEKEQRGFRMAQNIKRALDAEFYFYCRIFGFEPADEIEPVEIDNMAKF